MYQIRTNIYENIKNENEVQGIIAVIGSFTIGTARWIGASKRTLPKVDTSMPALKGYMEYKEKSKLVCVGVQPFIDVYGPDLWAIHFYTLLCYFRPQIYLIITLGTAGFWTRDTCDNWQG